MADVPVKSTEDAQMADAPVKSTADVQVTNSSKKRKAGVHSMPDADDPAKSIPNPINIPGPSIPGPNIPRSSILAPTALDILRYRYHHGTNVGGIYVLQRNLYPSFFPDDVVGYSELDAVSSWVKKIGVDRTKMMFKKHWSNAILDQDIDWLLLDGRCTTIRLPIGYWNLDPGALDGTPFEPYKVIYANSWSSICTLVSRLRAHSIGTLLDLHALPGGANRNYDSGTSSGTAHLWTKKSNRELAMACAVFIAVEVVKKGLDIVGLQIVNEADEESERMYEWYDDCINVISHVNPSLPLIISDAWNLRKAVAYSLQKNKPYLERPTCPIIIDTHRIWYETELDRAKSTQTIITEVRTVLDELDGYEGSVTDRGAVQVIVGKYNCSLDEESWTKASKGGAIFKFKLINTFGLTQTKLWQQRAGGAFFWTWKTELPGREHGLEYQASLRNILPPLTQLIPYSAIPFFVARADRRRNQRMHDALGQHVSYLQRFGRQSERWSFVKGWKTGYQDAIIFFQGKSEEKVLGGNRIGNLEIWVLKRMRECGLRGDPMWEFEQGLRRGVCDFYNVVNTLSSI